MGASRTPGPTAIERGWLPATRRGGVLPKGPPPALKLPDATPPSEVLVDSVEAAEILGVTRRAVYNAVGSGELRPASRLSRRVRFTLAEVEACRDRRAAELAARSSE